MSSTKLNRSSYYSPHGVEHQAPPKPSSQTKLKGKYEKHCTLKATSAITNSVRKSGNPFPPNVTLNQQVPNTPTPIFNWSSSAFNQQSHWRKICPKRNLFGPRAGKHGLNPCRSLNTAFQTRKLHFQPSWSRK